MAGIDLEKDGRDDRGSDRGSELLDGAERTAGAPRFVVGDVAECYVEEAAEAGAHPQAKDKDPGSRQPRADPGASRQDRGPKPERSAQRHREANSNDSAAQALNQRIGAEGATDEAQRNG